MPRTYVDNASNRKAGRVGMTHGSMVISSSGGGVGGGSSGYASYGSSSSSGRTYVDNASNRRAGRVGMDHGSMVISSSGGNTGRSYTSSNSSADRTYVDNPSNRSLGRVGLPLGSAVHSNAGSSGSYASSLTRTYVDNASNRSLGRVGQTVGTAVQSSLSSLSPSPRSAPENSSSTKCYVNNDYNKRLGRVGLPLGSAVQSSRPGRTQDGSISAGGSQRRYVDNPMNRRLGRVGKIVGTAVVSSNRNQTTISPVDAVFKPLEQIDPEDDNLGEILQQINQLRNELRADDRIADPIRENHCEAAIGIVHRHEAAITSYRAGLQTPEWVRGGEVVDFTDIALGEKIGSGGFGDVHVGIWKQRNQVAIKKLRVQRVSQEKKVQFQKEVKVFSSISHPAIVKFFGVCITPPNLAIIMEFMAAGSLYDVLHVEARQLSQLQKSQMITDCLSALTYLHERNITHRDIKSMNVMVCEDYTHCKLGDFGLALKEDSRSSASVADHAVVGTLFYSPPEVLEGGRLTVEQFKFVDIYSMTIVIVELLTRKIPYTGMNQHQVRRAIISGTRPSFASLNLGPDLTALLTNGMARSPTTRPTAADFSALWPLLSLDLAVDQLAVTSNVGASTTRQTITQSNPVNSSIVGRLPTLSELLESRTSNSNGSGNAAPQASRLMQSIASLGSSSSSSRINCPVCMRNPRSYSFVCGHMVCETCLPHLTSCPQCRGPVSGPRRIFF